MFGLFQKKPEVCNVLGDSITLSLTAEQTDGKYSVAEFATPGGVGQPPHTHAWDETYLVLEGELNLNICLLYTSPSPRDLSTSRMPSSA